MTSTELSSSSALTLLESRSSDDGRFSRVTPDDHGAWVWIPTLLAICYSFCFLGFRGIVKRRRLAADDAVVGAAYLVAIAHWATTLTALRSGLGKSTQLLDATDEKLVSQMTFAGRILLLVALYLSKCSTVLLVRSIFGHDVKSANRACNIALGVVGALGIVAVLVTSAGCSYKGVLAADADAFCSRQDVRWKIVVAFDALTEVAIVVLVSVFMIPLQMRRKNKVVVLLAFGTRLPTILFSVSFLRAFLSHLDRLRSERDPSLSLAAPCAWFESMLAYGLASATTPCLYNVLIRFRTGGVGFAGIE